MKRLKSTELLETFEAFEDLHKNFQHKAIIF